MLTLVLPVLIALGLLLLSLPIAWFFVRMGKPWKGYWIGLIPTLVSFVLSEGWIYLSCWECNRDPYCSCEWAWVGILTYLVLALVVAATYSTLVYGIARFVPRPYIPTPPPLPTSPPSSPPHRPSLRPLHHSRALYSSSLAIVLLLSAVLGGLSVYKVTDLVGRGYFVRWQSLGTDSREAAFYLKQDDKIDIFIQADYCRYHFRVAPPPGDVVESTEYLRCDSDSRDYVRYVQLADGSYWMWSHKIEWDLALLIARIFTPILGALLGFLLGVQIALRLPFWAPPQGDAGA
jgi:hypothetical protein